MDQLGDGDRGVAAELDEVGVADDAALGPAGRAGGVDDRRDVGAGGEGAATLDLGVRDLGSAGDELVQVAQADLPGDAYVRQIGAHLVEAGEVLRRLDDDGVGAGVGEVPLHLGGEDVS